MSKMIGKRESIDKNQRSMLFDGLSFASSEAYKLLRTNLMFAVAESGESSCKVIGITSSVRGEGKSVTALNLSYTIAQTNQSVLLVDADLRIPTIARRLGIPVQPGLSNLLVGQCTLDQAISPSGALDSFFAISSGTIPPNPSELLGSESMKKTLSELRKRFDYIIFDLPPVMLVSDALTLSPLLDGVIFTVRQDYVTRSAVAAGVRLFEVQKSKLLGFVVTDAKEVSSRYKKYKYGRSRPYRSSYSAYYQAASVNTSSHSDNSVPAAETVSAAAEEAESD